MRVVPGVTAGGQAGGQFGTQLRAPGVGAGAGANVTGEARTALRPQIGGAGAQAANNFRANWHTASPNQLQGFRTTFGSALQARPGTNVGMNNWLQANPNRAQYWSNWGGNVRNGFTVGASPFFNTGFWGGRNLVGLGLGGYGLGGSGLGIGGWGPGFGTGWWGYSPWLGNQPWGYWYGNPGWNTFASYNGWNTPYYYDYGPGGNVAYQGNQVYVNSQPVGTASEYSQSAADLAAVTQDEMNAQHEWVPLGTFSVATSQDENDPARVIQLAYDNKAGLVSGTILNKQSNNLYTVQGKVDPQTQRTAFTIGKDPNVVMETGLYNLTQQETPVLVHFGPAKTATYLFARLPEPSQSPDQPPATATAPPAEDLRR